jgi:hypothetical protein
MSEASPEPDKAEGPLSRVVEGVKLPAVKASEIVNQIADQAPLYGLSGAILAVGLVTGRRALARTGAQMLTSQLIAAVARAVSDRLLPIEDDTAKTTTAADAKPAIDVEPSESPKPAEASSPAKVATGALAGAAALAAGGWLLTRLLSRKSGEAKD